MRIHYALYDSDTVNSKKIYGISQQCFWTWWSDELADSPQQVYKMCNGLSSKLPTYDSKEWGGLLQHGNYTVLYRFFNAGSYGGEDKRPGRFVILTAWIKTDETFGKDMSNVFNDDVFQSVAKAAKANHSPIPEPERLSLRIVGGKTDGIGSLIPQFSWRGEYVYEGNDVLKRAMTTWAVDNGNRIRLVKIEKIESSENEQRAVFGLQPLPEPPPPEPPKPCNHVSDWQHLTINRLLLLLLFVMVVFVGIGSIAIMIFLNTLFPDGHEPGEPPVGQHPVVSPSNNGVNSLPVPPLKQPEKELSIDEIKRLFRQNVPLKQQIEVFSSLDRRAKRNLLRDYFEQQEKEEQKYLLDEFSKTYDSK